MNGIKKAAVITDINDVVSSTIVVVKRDGIRQSDGMRMADVLGWFHKQHSFSMDHALHFEGYTLHEEIFEVTAIRKDGEAVEPVIKKTLRAAKYACNRLTQDLGTIYSATEWKRTTGPAIKF